MPYIGEIRWFAGNFAPLGWLQCDGATYKVIDYNLLSTVLNGHWPNDGNFFQVPDLRGAAMVAAGPASLFVSQRTLGETGGTAQVVLESKHIPGHNHIIEVSSAPANNTTPGPSFTFATGAIGVKQYADTTKTSDPYASLSSKVIGPNIGAGQAPHNNMMTSLSMMPIIAHEGDFPAH